MVLKIHEGFVPDPIRLPYNRIVVADARFDRSVVGYVHNKIVLGNITSKKRKAVFPDSLHHYLPQLIESFSVLDSSSPATLFVLVKKFRVAENFITTAQNTVNDYFTLNLSASFYSLQGNMLTRLFAIENVFSHFVDNAADVKISLQYIKNQRSLLLSTMLHKAMASRIWSPQQNAPAFPLTDAEAAISKRFGLPVYGKPIGTGIYKTFVDFKTGTPADTVYIKRKKDGKIDVVFDKNGVEVLPKQVWGIADGSKHFISFRDEFVELVPNDRGFRLLSYRTQAELSGRAEMGDGRYTGFFGPFVGGNKIEEWFDLDMDTGQIFLEEVFGAKRRPAAQ